MASTFPEIALATDLQALLAGLRWRIRLYIWLEGIALALIWLGAMFWLSLAFDYLPVKLGATEMPAAARGILLALTGTILAWILYRFIARRTLVRLSDRSLALVLERRFGQFQDSLVTSVEMSALPAHASEFSRDLLTRSSEEARAVVDQVSYLGVFNVASLAQKIALALVVVGSVVALYVARAETFDRATQRLYLLSNEPWPRSARIEIAGIEVLRPTGTGDEMRAVTIPFHDKLVKVARGANVALKVKAAQVPEAEVVPQQCTVSYRSLKSGAGVRGERGSVSMTNFRDARDARNFWFDGKPFKGVLSTIEFDVLGYDHRQSGYRLEVVESPAVIETTLDLIFPPYLVDESTSSHLPVANQPYLPSGTFLPAGTEVTIHFKTNKPLLEARLVPSDGGEATTISLPGGSTSNQTFEYRIPALNSSVAIDISLLDTDNVATERPFRVFLTAVEDQPPQIEVALRGIGSAVTPDVIIPLAGKISDDYAIQQVWSAVQLNDDEERQRAVDLGKAGAVEQQIDFRLERSQPEGLHLKPGDKLRLAVKATDKFNLATDPHIATGDRYELDVVTPEELLSQLEVREIGLRRRFELIIDEMTQLRDSLLRVKASLSPGTAGASAIDAPSESDPDAQTLTPEQKAQRASELRLLRVSRAFQQSQKSVAEVAGVAAGFLGIREELINNRVDTEDRKNRLKEQIADPLNHTCTAQFPQLDQRLTDLEKALGQLGPGDPAAAGPPSDAAIDQADLVLAELEAVLAKMQNLETYNELLDIVRDLLKDQQQLLERTQQERKRQTLEDLKKLE